MIDLFSFKQGFVEKLASYGFEPAVAEQLCKQALVEELGKFLQVPGVAPALLGAGVGGGIGMLSGDEKNQWRRGLTGALLGGAGGYALGRYGMSQPAAASAPAPASAAQAPAAQAPAAQAPAASKQIAPPENKMLDIQNKVVEGIPERDAAAKDLVKAIDAETKAILSEYTPERISQMNPAEKAQLSARIQEVMKRHKESIQAIKPTPNELR